MKNFQNWIDRYKKKNDWSDLFNGEIDYGIGRRYTTKAPKFHDLPDYMQFGIFLQYLDEYENYYVGSVFVKNPATTISYYIEKIEDWC